MESSVFLTKYYKFLLSGLPAFIIAIPVNYFLVEWLYFSKASSYLFVIVFQVIMNFLISIRMVFFERGGYSFLNFIIFFAIVIAIRLVDWAAYSYIVQETNLYFLFIQAFNAIIFSFLKYFFLTILFRRAAKLHRGLNDRI